MPVRISLAYTRHEKRPEYDRIFRITVKLQLITDSYRDFMTWISNQPVQLCSATLIQGWRRRGVMVSP